MKRVERIAYYEELLNRTEPVLADLAKALEQYAEAREGLRKLEKYLGSAQWRKDFEADEAGELPEDLPRGVLSEDGIYNLLEENRELLETMTELVK